MARTISEIKAEISSAFISQEVVRSAYGLDDNTSFDKAFSPISIESVLFYVVASCIWILESLFEKHKTEVETGIEQLRPHTLRWYVSKTLDYMHNGKFILTDGVVAADYYDTTGMSESDIEKKRIVKYAVATESNTQVFIKVAKADSNGRPKRLSANEQSGLEFYLSQIKDAGVAIKVLNEPADKMNVELVVLYDPSKLTAVNISDDDADEEYRELTITSIENEERDVIAEAVQSVVARLPFNGEYRNADLMAAVQAIDGVEVVDVANVEVCANGSEQYAKVVGYRRPYSGYYELNNITVRGRAYKVAE